MTVPLSTVLIAPCALALRPDPTTVPVNAIISITDQLNKQYQSDGSNWVEYSGDAGAGIPSNTVADLTGTGTAGVSDDYSRGDHTHGLAAGLALVRVASVALTDANIKALPTTPITVVAAPGAGFRVKILGATLSINNGGGDYTNINATYCELRLQTVGGTIIATPMFDDVTVGLAYVTELLAGTNGRKYWDFSLPYLSGRDAGATAGDWSYVTGFVAGSAEADNDAIQLAVDNNGSGVFTGGNVANVGLIVVTYTIEALAP